MATLQDSDTIAQKNKVQVHSARASFLVLLMAVAGYALTVLVFYPGYVTVDARFVYADAQAWQFGDWQSPAMGVLWRLIDPIAPGSLSMFLLTVTLYWLGFGMLALIAARRSIWLGLVTPLLAFAPPAFFFVGMVWRDILFGVVWLAAVVLAFAVAGRTLRRAGERSEQPARQLDDARAGHSPSTGLVGARVRIARWKTRVNALVPLQAIALLLVALGVLLRPNAIFAAPFLAAYVVWPLRFEVKRMAIVFVPAVVLFYALVPLTYYGLLDAKRQNPLHSILVFDLGGITHFAGENQFPVTWSADETALLMGKCYNPVRWDSYWHVPPCPFVMQRLERPDDLIFGTPRLVEAWWRAVSAHPLAYLQHRAAFMWQFLARSNLVLPVWDWPDPAALASEASGQRGNSSEVRAPDTRPEPGSSARAALASEASGQRGNSIDAGAGYGHSPYFKPLVALHDALQPTILFRPGLWLVLAVAVGAFSWRARGTPAGAFAVAATASAIVYVMTFFVVGVAADFRYAYWCVLATLAGAVAAVLARYERRAM